MAPLRGHDDDKTDQQTLGTDPVKQRRPGWQTGWYRGGGKRCLDLLLALLLLLPAAPLLVIAAVLIKLESRGPVLFIQGRLGRAGRLFRVLKLRTMTDRPRKAHQQVWDDNPEVTRVGRWLRRTKIDELPQLWNVIRGEMSVVGPRPGLHEHLSQFDHRGWRRIRFSGRPIIGSRVTFSIGQTQQRRHEARVDPGFSVADIARINRQAFV